MVTQLLCGGVQLIVFFSWIVHEIKREDEMASYKEDENQDYLWIRQEVIVVEEIIKSHKDLFKHADLELIID